MSKAHETLTPELTRALKRVWLGEATSADPTVLRILLSKNLIISVTDAREYVITDAGRMIVGNIPS